MHVFVIVARSFFDLQRFLCHERSLDMHFRLFTVILRVHSVQCRYLKGTCRFGEFGGVCD